jgi:hypothetical protein
MKKRKFNIYEIVKSILLYGCETRRLAKRNMRALEAMEINIIRHNL